MPKDGPGVLGALGGRKSNVPHPENAIDLLSLHQHKTVLGEVTSHRLLAPDSRRRKSKIKKERKKERKKFSYRLRKVKLNSGIQILEEELALLQLGNHPKQDFSSCGSNQGVNRGQLHKERNKRVNKQTTSSRRDTRGRITLRYVALLGAFGGGLNSV